MLGNSTRRGSEPRQRLQKRDDNILSHSSDKRQPVDAVTSGKLDRRRNHAITITIHDMLRRHMPSIPKTQCRGNEFHVQVHQARRILSSSLPQIEAALHGMQQPI